MAYKPKKLLPVGTVVGLRCKCQYCQNWGGRQPFEIVRTEMEYVDDGITDDEGNAMLERVYHVRGHESSPNPLETDQQLTFTELEVYPIKGGTNGAR